MASTNQSPFYQKAEQEYLEAKNDEDRIACLEVMIKECPKHKSSENMLRNLKNRLRKLKEGIERQKKAGKGGGSGIKKSDMQAVLVGFANSGKSTLFNLLTTNKADSKVSEHPFTTPQPVLGVCEFEGAQIQIVDDSAIPNQDKSLINSTDTILLVLDSIEQIEKIEKYVWKSSAKKIYLINKIDNLCEAEKRKLDATVKSKYRNLDFVLFNKNASKIEINSLKKKIFESFPIIRVYTKEPKKEPSIEPMILKIDSTISDAAEKILKGMSRKIKRARIWGPSSKFSGQVVGLDHKLKDKDIIEFQTL